MAKSFEVGDKVIGSRSGVGYMGCETSRSRGTIVSVETNVDSRGIESEKITIEDSDGGQSTFDTADSNVRVRTTR